MIFKRMIPLIIASAAGTVMILAWFIPPFQDWSSVAQTWFNILAAIAMVLGGANLLKIHLQKISQRRAGWGYSAVVVASFLITLSVGLAKVGVPPDPEHTDLAWSGNYSTTGSAIWWLFFYIIFPVTATMFALLAFFVASAAYRAFRAKNTAALLLLGTAFLVLLGRSDAGAMLDQLLPEDWRAYGFVGATEFIMSVFNAAGQRAIMIGVALGIVATSLKIILTIDRSYLGSD